MFLSIYSDDDTPVLDRVSFKIPAGRSIALVGPSGSGRDDDLFPASKIFMM